MWSQQHWVSSSVHNSSFQQLHGSGIFFQEVESGPILMWEMHIEKWWHQLSPCGLIWDLRICWSLWAPSPDKHQLGSTQLFKKDNMIMEMDFSHSKKPNDILSICCQLSSSMWESSGYHSWRSIPCNAPFPSCWNYFGWVNCSKPYFKIPNFLHLLIVVGC